MAGTLIYLSPNDLRAIRIAGHALTRVRGSDSAAPFRAKLGPSGTERLGLAVDGLSGIRKKVVRLARLERSSAK
jgi:hypothetical protein